jgi:hypothetical protein
MQSTVGDEDHPQVVASLSKLDLAQMNWAKDFDPANTWHVNSGQGFAANDPSSFLGNQRSVPHPNFTFLCSSHSSS